MERKVSLEDSKIHIVGTSHVSGDSVNKVREKIDEVDPDLVAVELDQTRYDSLMGEDTWKDLDLGEAISEGKGFLIFMNVILSIYQRQLGLEQEKPGSDMMAAIEAAEERDVEVALVDRDINETFRRTREEMTFREKIKLLYSLVGFTEEVEPDELENEDIIKEIVAELSKDFPSIKKTFLDERNEYMASELLERGFDTAVLVVGAAHMEGVAERLENRDLPEIKKADSFPWEKVLKYGFPAIILASIGATFVFVGLESALEASISFIIINAVTAFIGAVIAKAHPLNVFGSTIAAPYTAIDPFLGAGMISGYLQAKLSPPKVGDMEELSELVRYRDLWGNRAGRVILAFFFVTLASAAGTIISVPYLLTFLPF